MNNTMQTNNLFSFQRFLMLCKQSLIINKKMITISLTGMAGILFIILLFIQAARNFQNWPSPGYIILFIFCFITLGAIYISNSFPAFRSKEKSMAYLMLPATSSEKFLFEFLSRIVLFIVLMPLFFITVVYFETFIIRHFVTGFEQFTISDLQIGNEHFMVTYVGGITMPWNWSKYILFQHGLFMLLIIFTGASHFSKSPLLKTFFAITIIYIGFGFFIYLLTKGLGLNGESTRNLLLPFSKNKESFIVISSILITIFNLSLLVMSFFRLKEKEA